MLEISISNLLFLDFKNISPTCREERRHGNFEKITHLDLLVLKMFFRF